MGTEEADSYAESMIAGNASLLVPYFLMASYLYYIADKALFSDGWFDTVLCPRLYKEWGSIKHVHKHLINHSDLQAGTGFYLKEGDYPNITKDAAHGLYRRFHAGDQAVRSASKPKAETRGKRRPPRARRSRKALSRSA